MAYQLWLAKAAARTGFPVIECTGWMTRGSSSFYPRGVVAHHTAGPSTGDMPSLPILINGRSDLPGPLCNYGLGRSGTIYVVAAGKANHAGLGSWKGLVGNSSVVGIEAENRGNGTDTWPNVQLNAYVALVGEICIELGIDPDYACGHKEWAPSRKIDPNPLSMPVGREQVRAYIKNPHIEESAMFLPLVEGDGMGDKTHKKEDVHLLQRMLNRLDAGLDADGKYGPATVTAVKDILVTGDGDGTIVSGFHWNRLDWLVAVEAAKANSGGGDGGLVGHNHAKGTLAIDDLDDKTIIGRTGGARAT